MIELLQERRVSLTQLARELDVSISTICRWTNPQRGARGKILESFNLGGRKYTTYQALERFISNTNAPQITGPTSRTSRQRESEIARAERRLKTDGI